MKLINSSRQAGFGAVEALLIVIIVALAGALGWVAYTKFVIKPTTDTANVQKADGVADLEKPVQIETNEDINNASQDIDAVDIDDSDILSDAEKSIDDI